MRLCPHDNSTDSTVAAYNAHFMGPLRINSPSTNSISTKAPTYTGPLVMGWLPQYCPSCWYICMNSGSAFDMAVLFSVSGTDAPPLALGTSRVHVSSMP